MKRLTQYLVAACALTGLLLTVGAAPATAQSGWSADRFADRRDTRHDAGWSRDEARRIADEIRSDERRVRELWRDHDREARCGHRAEARDIRERIDRLERDISRNRHRLEEVKREARDDGHDRDWRRR